MTLGKHTGGRGGGGREEGKAGKKAGQQSWEYQLRIWKMKLQFAALSVPCFVEVVKRSDC